MSPVATDPLCPDEALLPLSVGPRTDLSSEVPVAASFGFGRLTPIPPSHVHDLTGTTYDPVLQMLTIGGLPAYTAQWDGPTKYETREDSQTWLDRD